MDITKRGPPQASSRPFQRQKRLKVQPASTTHLLCPSPQQMRLLWEHDNKCGHKYMGAPLRSCKSVEEPDKLGVSALSQETMSLIMSDIENMWKRLSFILEIFIDKEHPNLGYRIRVKDGLPLKLSMKQSDQVLLGWKAVIPKDCVSQHLYERSDMSEDHQYLGGPASFCNWAPPSSSTLIVRQISHGSGRHHVRAETRGALQGGTELVWDYGKKNMPTFYNENWFKAECCSVSQTVKNKSPKKRKVEVFRELCVLCGGPYRSNSHKSVERNAQKKVHFLNSHVDYLGSEWNGCGEFTKNVHPINYDQALLQAERLNRLLQRLHSNGWKVIPACRVLARLEEAENGDMLMNKFRKRCAFLKGIGCVVLRGCTVPTTVEDLVPVPPCRWDRVFSKGEKPNRVYAMTKPQLLANKEKLDDWLTQDVMLVLNDGADASSEEEDISDDDSGN